MKLTDDNFLLYAMKNYSNPQCETVDEFREDLNRIKYIKRLISRYAATGELKERLLLNHIIVFYNVFGIVPATKMLLYKIDKEYYPIVKPFLVYLSFVPPHRVDEGDLINCDMDEYVITVLRNI